MDFCSNQNWGFMNGLMMFAWLAIVVIGVYLLVKSAKKNGKAILESSSDSAIEILRKRYARGEITKDEFEEKKRNLES